jgi:putative ABC transport system permease protein
VHQVSLAVTQPDAIYIPARQSPFVDRRLSLVARVTGEPSASAAAIRDAIASVDKDQPVLHETTMDELVSASAAERKFALTLFEIFAVTALLLSALGLYGVLAGSVAERTRELAIRSALGATRSGVIALVVGQGLSVAAAGIAIGLIGAVAAARATATLLFGTTPLDPATYAVVVSLLLGVSGLAAAIPAWRASRVDPMAALRQE